MTTPARHFIVRNTRPEDFPAIIALSRQVYPETPPWRLDQLASHLRIFPEGQFVVVEKTTGVVHGMTASLIILWDDYDMRATWQDFTDTGMFTNHDPVRGRTLYSAEAMVWPAAQRRGIGTKLFTARRDLTVRLKLLRMRAGGRLRGYHRYATRLSPEEYAIKVARGELQDPTLSYQLKCGYRILGVVPNYLPHDPESLGHVAVIEWINDEVAAAGDYTGRDPRYNVSARRPPG